MISKAKTKCQNGHTVEFGPCNNESKKLFFLKSVCTSRDLEVLSHDEIQCRRCNTIHMARPCPECGDHVPVAKFKLKSLKERIDKQKELKW